MQQFFGYAIPGIPYGCTFALFAVGLILTYQATGVFNFAFAAQAYASTYLYMFLSSDQKYGGQGWPVWAAFLISVVIMAPALGWAFDFFLFRRIPNTNVLAKVVTSISLLIGIPQIMTVIFGTRTLYNAKPVIFRPDHIYFHLFGMKLAPIDGKTLSVILVTIVVLVALTVLMRFTSLGLKMRASVESRRLVQLEGVNATKVVNLAWMISSLLAGLAGVLLAPEIIKLSTQVFITIMVTAFAAAAWGVMRSMPIAAGVAIAIGIADFVMEGYLHSWSLNTDIIEILPMVVLIAALLILPGMRNLEEIRDPLSTVDPPAPTLASAARSPRMDRITRRLWWVVLAGFIISMFTWLPITWRSTFNEGLCFSIIFLSISMITGLAGQLSIAQATLAGVGAFTAAQLAQRFNLDVLLGALVGAVFAALVAVVISIFSLKLKGIGLALMTLAAALIFNTVVFPLKSVGGPQSGITLPLTSVPFGLLTTNGRSFFILSMIVITAIVVMIILLRKGTIGRYLAAMRGSEVGASGIGINTNWMRILIFALAGAVAGIGGTLFSIFQQTVTKTPFNYQFSLIFVVVVITTGVMTVEGAIQAGIGLVVSEKLVTTFAPSWVGGPHIVIVLFAFGALTYAKHPEGILEFQRRQSTAWFDRHIFKHAVDG